eukprot:11160547-Lingulodinium_polyedra.AAC.1
MNWQQTRLRAAALHPDFHRPNTPGSRGRPPKTRAAAKPNGDADDPRIADPPRQQLALIGLAAT